MSNKQFGQEVILTIEDENGREILNTGEEPKFDTAGLRIDFDIRYISEFARAKITLWNLNDETIGNLIGGNHDHYVTLKTRLHGKQEFVLADSFFISNFIDEKKIPNTLSTMYCFDKTKKAYLEQDINITVNQPSLFNQIRAIMAEVGYTGKVTYNSFPNDQHKVIPDRPNVPRIGKVKDELDKLAEEFQFLYYPTTAGLLIMFKPDLTQVADTDLESRDTIVLQTNNMRANPMLAPAQLQVTSNLDGELAPGAILDVSELLTAGLAATQDQKDFAHDFASKSVSGFSLYQVISVQHKGSNFTSEWHSIATAIAPQRGTSMPTQTWWR